MQRSDQIYIFSTEEKRNASSFFWSSALNFRYIVADQVVGWKESSDVRFIRVWPDGGRGVSPDLSPSHHAGGVPLVQFLIDIFDWLLSFGTHQKRCWNIDLPFIVRTFNFYKTCYLNFKGQNIDITF